MKKSFYALALILTPWASYANDIELLTSTAIEGGQAFSASMSALILMTLMAMLPTVIMVMTPFLRITIVLSILRSAMGLTSVPTNKVLASISLVVTFFIMTPVIEVIYDTSVTPYLEGTIEVDQAVALGVEPLKEFMLRQTKVEHLEKFLTMSGKEFTAKDEIPLHVATTAFITSEIQTALKIGFMIYLPFVLIDLVVATVLMSLGLMMMSPMIISTPIKIMLFVVVDGWMLIIDSLSKSFFMV